MADGVNIRQGKLRTDRRPPVRRGCERSGCVEQGNGRGVAVASGEGFEPRRNDGAAAQEHFIYVGRDLYAAGELLPWVSSRSGRSVPATGETLSAGRFVLRSAGGEAKRVAW